jgi:colicin import membrane protein
MRGKGFRIMVATILSTVIHFFILTLLDTIPLISKEIPQRNLYMVDLVPAVVEQPAPKQEEKPAVQQKVDKVKKEEVKKEEVKKEEVKKEEPKQETVKEDTTKDAVVLEDPSKKKATPGTATTESTEEPTAKEEEQRLAAIKDIEQKVSDRPTTDAPVMTDAEIQEYPLMVEDRVKGFWVIPDLLSGRDFKAVVIFKIDEKGEVINLRFKQSSGNIPYDQSVIRAIRKAVPFSPPPHVLLEEEYVLTFEPKL